jgi:thymidylate synthase ThyX
MYSVKIVADSLNEYGNRITTFVCTLPRILLAEANTHRMLSRNSASSRAIPTTKMLSMVQDDPFIPIYWGKNQKGMQANEELSNEAQFDAQEAWLRARDNAVTSAKQLMEIGVHKQIANRLLEPFNWHTMLITATEWENFFALRAHKDAQPEFQKLAYEMLNSYNVSVPKRLKTGEWHIPYGDKYIGDLTTEQMLKVCVARAARVSYQNFEGDIDFEKDFKLHDTLLESGHLSPFEHCAQAGEPVWSGNFLGWKQYRKLFSNENRKDERVKALWNEK